MTKTCVRDWIIVVLMTAGGIGLMLIGPQKYAAQEKVHLENFVPQDFAGWRSVAYDMSDYDDEWQSINEILIRTYTETTTKESIDLILEYSSDMRKSFSLHFPENCYRAGGNGIIMLDPVNVTLPDGKQMIAKSLIVKGLPGKRQAKDMLIVYWLTIDNKHIHETMKVKFDQLFSGFISKGRRGFLVRMDVWQDFEHTPEGINKAQQKVAHFLSDLYTTLDEQQKLMVIGSN